MDRKKRLQQRSGKTRNKKAENNKTRLIRCFKEAKHSALHKYLNHYLLESTHDDVHKEDKNITSSHSNQSNTYKRQEQRHTPVRKTRRIANSGHHHIIFPSSTLQRLSRTDSTKNISFDGTIAFRKNSKQKKQDHAFDIKNPEERTTSKKNLKEQKRKGEKGKEVVSSSTSNHRVYIPNKKQK